MPFGLLDWLRRPRWCRVRLQRNTQTLATLNLERADTPWRRARGLMGRTAVEGDGMLFIYPWPRVARIWMAGTRIPLDVLFIDRAGQVVALAEGLQPHDKHPVSSGRPVKWVIELPAGRVVELGVRTGDVLELLAT